MIVRQKIIYYFISLLYQLPFLRVTDDANFGTITIDSKQLRFSLFSLNIGTIIIFFISYGFWRGTPNQQSNALIFPKGFRWFYIIRFSVFEEQVSTAKHDQLKIDHINFLSVSTPTNLSSYKEGLVYRINQIKDTMTLSFNKFLAYLAIVVFIIPLYVPSFLKFNSIFRERMWIQWTYFIITYYLFYFLINWAVFLKKFIMIKSHRRSKYGDVKNDPQPELALINSYYLDFQHMKAESTNDVSYMRNIEKHITYTLVLSFILLLFTTTTTSNSKEPVVKVTHNAQYQIKMVDLSKSATDVIQASETELTDLKTSFLADKIKQVVLISSVDTSQENYIRINQLIRSYNVHNVPIAEVPATANSSGSDQVQILYERR
jgi:hypothetical protein